MGASKNRKTMDDNGMPSFPRVSKKRRRPTEVVAHERKDLQSCLEHLIAVGLKEKREAERYQEFRASGPPTMAENEHQDRQNAATHTSSQVDEYSLDTANTKTRGNKSSALKEVFVEDIRLYGETSSFKYDGLERQPWPLSKRLLPAKTGIIKSQVVQNMDQNWELEYGDSIHPLAFSAARLSQRLVPPTSITELNAINGSNLNVATTETSLAEQDVPRALLLRCWQRAVDAASQTTLASMKSESLGITENGRNVGGALAAPAAPGLHPTAYHDVFSSYLFGGSILGLGNSNADTGPIIPQPTPVEEPAFVAAQRELAEDRLTMKRKCTSLGLGLTKSQLPTDVSERACPACYRQFEQLNELQQHYYGERDQKGCCWRRIAQKEPRIVADILENHVKSQIDQYLGLIMDKALGKFVRDGDVDSPKRKRSRCFNWYDVLEFTEEAVISSFDVEVSKAEPRKGTHPIFETLQRKSGCDPLVLNPAVVRSAQKRLIDRYAKVPR